MRRPLLIAVPALVAALVVPAGASTLGITPPARPDPCTLTMAGNSGDGNAFFGVPTTVEPNDPDVDITGFTMQLTRTELVTTITVPGLTDHPLLAAGDLFEATVTAKGGGSATFGYLRDVDGGRPQVSSGGAFSVGDYPGLATLPRYDLGHGTVTLTISRAVLAKELHVPVGSMVLRGLRVDSELYSAGKFVNYGDTVAAADFEVLDGVRCDHYLARKRPVPSPCTVTVSDPVADEVSQAGHDDDVDIVSVSLSVRGNDITRTIHLARLQDRPPLGTQHSFTGKARITGLPAGRTFEGLWLGNDVYDKDASTVTSTLTKADVMRALGVKTLRGLNLRFTQTTAQGSAADTRDIDLASDTPAVSFSRC